MPITHIRPGRTNTPAREQKSKRSLAASLASLATLATIATVAAITLSLLGYGIAISVESTFGVPHTQIFTSSTDLLSLSTWAIIEIFDLRLWDLVGPQHRGIEISALLVSAFAMAYWVLQVRINFWPTKRWWQPKKWSLEKRGRFLMWMTPIAGLLGAGATCVAYGLIFAGLYVVVTLIGARPSIGMTTGKDFLERNVVAPQHCVSIHSRDALIEKYEAEKRSAAKGEKTHLELGATCVQVLRDGKVLAKGRVAISTTEYLVLFDPVSGLVQRVPTREAIVQPVSSL